MLVSLEEKLAEIKGPQIGRDLTREATRRCISEIFEQCVPQSGLIVELGCGLSQLTDLAPKPWRSNFLAQVDCELDYLRLNQANHPHDSFLTADVHTLPFRSGSIDIIVVLNLIDLLENPTAAIFEIARVLKPGGVLLHLQDYVPTPLWIFRDLKASQVALPFTIDGQVGFCVVDRTEFQAVRSLLKIPAHLNQPINDFLNKPLQAYMYAVAECRIALEHMTDVVRSLPPIMKGNIYELQVKIAEKLAAAAHEAGLQAEQNACMRCQCTTARRPEHDHHLEAPLNAVHHDLGVTNMRIVPGVSEEQVVESVTIHYLKAVKL